MMFTGPTPSKEQTAYHEAAHAVAIILLGMELEYVTIEATADSWGHAKPRPYNVSVIDELAMIYAGQYGEFLFDGNRQGAAINFNIMDGDKPIKDEIVERYVAAGGPMPALALEAAGEKRACELIERDAPEIVQALANRLLQQETLTGTDVDALLATFERNEDGRWIARQ